MKVNFSFIANTQINESLKIVGSCEELGSWDIRKGVLLETGTQIYPLWQQSICLEKSQASNL